MSDIIPGNTFVNGQQVNASDLNDLVNNAVIASAVVDHTHLKNTSIVDSVFGFPLIATADISNDDYVLVWSATNGDFRRVKKSDFNDLVAEGLTANTTTINSVTGDVTLAGANYSQLNGTFTFDEGSGQYVKMGGGNVFFGPSMNLLFPTSSLSGSASITNSIGISKDPGSPLLKVYSPDTSATGVELRTYGSITAIAKANGDNGLLTLSGKGADSAIRDWFTQSMNDDSKLWITPSASNVAVSGNPKVQLGSSTQIVDLELNGNINKVSISGGNFTQAGGLFKVQGSADSNLINTDGISKVGIGTVPGLYKLEIDGDCLIKDTGDNFPALVLTGSAGVAVQLQDTSTQGQTFNLASNPAGTNLPGTFGLGSIDSTVHPVLSLSALTYTSTRATFTTTTDHLINTGEHIDLDHNDKPSWNGRWMVIEVPSATTFIIVRPSQDLLPLGTPDCTVQRFTTYSTLEVRRHINASELFTILKFHNLPRASTEPAWLEPGQVWVDTDDKTLKIKDPYT